MSSEKVITQLDPNESNPFFQLGYLSGTCKGAIGELERFLENFNENLSETQIFCINNTIHRIKSGLERFQL
jgi:hypothetical protein